MGFLREVQHGNVTDLRACRFGFAGNAQAADNVGVYPRAAEVFAHFFHHQAVQAVHGQGGHEGLGPGKQLHFPLNHGLSGQGFNKRCFFIGIFHNGHAADDGHLFQNDLGHIYQQARQLGLPQAVKLPGPARAAQTHHQFFAHAAFHTALEGGVGLDAVYRDDGVHGKGRIQHIGHEPVRSLADAAAGVAGNNLDAHVLFGNSQTVENLFLPLGRAAAVAAHGGQQHGGCAALAHHGDGGCQHGADVLDAAAAGGNAHCSAGLDARRKATHLGSHCGNGVVHPGAREALAHAGHGR